MRPGKSLAAVLLLGVTVAIAACEQQTGTDTSINGVTKGEACSVNNVSGMFESHRYPAVDEGSGRVGLMYYGSGDVIVPDELYATYRLHDCRTGKQQGFDAYMLRETRYRGVDMSLEEFVKAAREDGLMSRPRELMATARKAGFTPVASQPAREHSADYAACACQLFYPETAAPAVP